LWISDGCILPNQQHRMVSTQNTSHNHNEMQFLLLSTTILVFWHHVIGTQITGDCSCSPTQYTFQLDLSAYWFPNHQKRNEWHQREHEHTRAYMTAKLPLEETSMQGCKLSVADMLHSSCTMDHLPRNGTGSLTCHWTPWGICKSVSNWCWWRCENSSMFDCVPVYLMFE